LSSKKNDQFKPESDENDENVQGHKTCERGPGFVSLVFGLGLSAVEILLTCKATWPT